jgi:hypothetical protein
LALGQNNTTAATAKAALSAWVKDLCDQTSMCDGCQRELKMFANIFELWFLG